MDFPKNEQKKGDFRKYTARKNHSPIEIDKPEMIDKETDTPIGETPGMSATNGFKTYSVNEIMNKAMQVDLTQSKDLTRDAAKSVAKGSLSFCGWLCLLPFISTIWIVKCIIRIEIYITKSILLFFFPDLSDQIQNSKKVMTNAV